jgi:membrane fusion protein (multidrug efflux system)
MKTTYAFRIMVVAALLFATMILTGCKDKDSIANADVISNGPPAIPVSVIAVKPVVMQDVVYLPGETEAYEDVLLAANTSGRVDWIGCSEGQEVNKGERLAKIDVSALKASLEHAKAAYELANDLCERRRRLFENKIIAQEELDQSETQLKLAAADLEQVKVRYNHGFPKSPIAGIIDHLYVDVGEYADTGKPIADIVNIDRIKINVRVPEMDVRYVKKGQKTPVRIDAFADRTIIGTVEFVAFKADPATKTFLVRSVIDNPDHDIRPGMIGRVAFVRRHIPDALAVPLFAIVDKGGERIVFVEKDGMAEARVVTIGVIEEDRVQITTGLNIGDHLIVRGHTEVEDGMKVMVN